MCNKMTIYLEFRLFWVMFVQNVSCSSLLMSISGYYDELLSETAAELWQ